MRLYNFLFYVLLISFVRCWSVWPPVNQPQRLLIVLSPVSAQQDISNEWETARYPAFKTPQVQIQVLKGYVSPDRKWMYSNEYKYSNQHYEAATKIPFTIDHAKAKTLESGNHVAQKNKDTPSFRFRTVIDPPVSCPEGQKLDKNNVCREYLE